MLKFQHNVLEVSRVVDQVFVPNFIKNRRYIQVQSRTTFFLNDNCGPMHFVNSGTFISTINIQVSSCSLQMTLFGNRICSSVTGLWKKMLLLSFTYLKILDVLSLLA